MPQQTYMIIKKNMKIQKKYLVITIILVAVIFLSLNLVKFLNILDITHYDALKNIEVPLSDGSKLRVNVFQPEGGGKNPTIITALPYHKDDMGMSLSFLPVLHYTEAGYTVVVADLIGTGASDSTATHPLEMMNPRDIYELIEWSAVQKWSNGEIAIFGVSYGGVSAIIGAQEKPPHLKALLTIVAPTNFYSEVALPGGSLNMMGAQGAWLGLMNMLNLVPPLERKNLDQWKAIWNDRMDNYLPFTIVPTSHINYDAYWKKYKVKLEQVDIPTFIIDGWYGFTHRDSFISFNKIKNVEKFIVGPWAHITPIIPKYESINYLKETIKFFDKHLKKDSSIKEEPPLSIYVAGGKYWKYEKKWPPARAQETEFHLNSNKALVSENDTKENILNYKHNPAVGTSSGLMLIFPHGHDYPKEQSKDDSKSLSFDAKFLDRDFEIVGEPEVTLTLSTDMPDAAITVRLTDVSPDGKSQFITRGWLRLSKRKGIYTNSPVLKNKYYNITIKCLPIDYLIKKGNKLRLNIQLSDFPKLFPLPYKGSIDLKFGINSIQKLNLLTLKGKKIYGSPKFEPMFSGLTSLLVSNLLTAVWEVKRNEKEKKTIVKIEKPMKLPFLHFEKPIETNLSAVASIIDDDPASAKIISTCNSKFMLDGKKYFIMTEQITTYNSIQVKAKILEDEKVIYEKKFDKKILIDNKPIP